MRSGVCLYGEGYHQSRSRSSMYCDARVSLLTVRFALVIAPNPDRLVHPGTSTDSASSKASRHPTAYSSRRRTPTGMAKRNILRVSPARSVAHGPDLMDQYRPTSSTHELSSPADQPQALVELALPPASRCLSCVPSQTQSQSRPRRPRRLHTT